jgi:hypothetical protein
MIGHSTYGFVTSYSTQSAFCGGNVVEPLMTSVLFIQIPLSVGLVNLGLLSSDAEAGDESGNVSNKNEVTIRMDFEY